MYKTFTLSPPGVRSIHRHKASNSCLYIRTSSVRCGLELGRWLLQTSTFCNLSSLSAYASSIPVSEVRCCGSTDVVVPSTGYGLGWAASRLTISSSSSAGRRRLTIIETMAAIRKGVDKMMTMASMKPLRAVLVPSYVKILLKKGISERILSSGGR